jgi:hypothetical protein
MVIISFDIAAFAIIIESIYSDFGIMCTFLPTRSLGGIVSAFTSVLISGSVWSTRIWVCSASRVDVIVDNTAVTATSSKVLHSCGFDR